MRKLLLILAFVVSSISYAQEPSVPFGSYTFTGKGVSGNFSMASGATNQKLLYGQYGRFTHTPDKLVITVDGRKSEYVRKRNDHGNYSYVRSSDPSGLDLMIHVNGKTVGFWDLKRGSFKMYFIQK